MGNHLTHISARKYKNVNEYHILVKFKFYFHSRFFFNPYTPKFLQNFEAIVIYFYNELLTNNKQIKTSN